MLHWLAHLLKINLGLPETWWEGDVLVTGFKCSKCGKISNDVAKRKVFNP